MSVLRVPLFGNVIQRVKVASQIRSFQSRYLNTYLAIQLIFKRITIVFATYMKLTMQ